MNDLAQNTCPAKQRVLPSDHAVPDCRAFPEVPLHDAERGIACRELPDGNVKAVARGGHEGNVPAAGRPVGNVQLGQPGQALTHVDHAAGHEPNPQ